MISLSGVGRLVKFLAASSEMDLFVKEDR